MKYLLLLLLLVGCAEPPPVSGAIWSPDLPEVEPPPIVTPEEFEDLILETPERVWCINTETGEELPLRGGLFEPLHVRSMP